MPKNFHYWPYEEVKASRANNQNEFLFTAPWASAKISVDSLAAPKVEALVEAMQSGQVTPDQLGLISWVFGTLKDFPLAYILPSIEKEQKDHYTNRDHLGKEAKGPKDLAFVLFPKLELDSAFLKLSHREHLGREWRWDFASALEFSKTPEASYSPASLFTVARRFHLLDSQEDNKTNELYDFVRGLKGEQFKRASAIIVRQNHYVTETCRKALSPAIQIAQSAEESLRDFLQAEDGHDAILERALRSIGFAPHQLVVVEAVEFLMNLFGLIGQRNFLAFTFMVDMFERNSYAKRDPLASLVESGGLMEAGANLNLHKDINDKGAHENVALTFLDFMAPVSHDYALEALKLAELATLILHQVSINILEHIRRDRGQ